MVWRVKQVRSLQKIDHKDVDGLDYQILLEADFLVNGDESNLTKEAIEKMKKNVFKTKTGIELLNHIFEL